jgi:hypothetical protein
MKKPFPYRRLLRTIREAGVSLFWDRIGGPSIVIPDDPRRRRWPLDSDRAKAWIVGFALDVLKRPLQGVQLATTMMALKHQAYLGDEENGDLEILWNSIEPGRGP